MVKHIKPAALLLCISLLSLHFVPAHAQEGFDNRKALYGLHLGFTENRVDIYHTQGGEAYALKEGNHSFYAPGTRISVIWDFRMGDHFRLRAMPGVSLIGRTWVPDNISIPTSPSVEYKVKNVCGELPIDVKWIPFRWGNRQLYLASGLSYSFDFTSFNKDLDEGTIQRLNTHDLRFICGIGYEFDTRYFRLGIELKVDCFSLLPTNTGGSHPNDFYFKNGPSFGFGFIVEA
jgi:hypothetical protein